MENRHCSLVVELELAFSLQVVNNVGSFDFWLCQSKTKDATIY